tara:strand:+ start:146 stop:1036 length:891 start_codon:yes stop_codon:yes gene_type:complete
MPKKTKRRKNKKKNKTRKLKIKCAPKAKNETLPYTCYTAKGLHKIKNIWNKKHPDRKIKSNRPRNIWRALQYALKKSCNRESCWLKQKFIKENIDLETKEYTFAPEAPKEWKENPNEWLTSIDILEVMKQYERTYKCFDFIGPSPIDYDKHIAYGECVWEELCEFSLKKQLKEGKTKIGIVFNLDPHNKPGSHWVAMFIHTKKKEIYYLDSYGEKIPRQIKKFAKKVQKQSLKIGDKKEYKLIENKRRHQFSESECGMYSLYFIIQMLKGTTFKKFTSKRIKDNYMMKLRKIYFNQ